MTTKTYHPQIPMTISVSTEHRGKGPTRRAARAWRRAAGVTLPQSVKLAKGFWYYKELIQYLEFTCGCLITETNIICEEIVCEDGQTLMRTIVTMESPTRSKRFWVTKHSYIEDLEVSTTNPWDTFLEEEKKRKNNDNENRG